MAQVSKVLRSTTEGYLHWCPGCEHAHHIWTKTKHPNGAVWGFNGNVDVPSFTPSVRIYVPAHKDEDGTDYPEHTTCHYFITDGVIRFCGDCDHKLNGQNVPLPELPPPADYHYGDEA